MSVGGLLSIFISNGGTNLDYDPKRQTNSFSVFDIFHVSKYECKVFRSVSVEDGFVEDDPVWRPTEQIGVPASRIGSINPYIGKNKIIWNIRWTVTLSDPETVDEASRFASALRIGSVRREGLYLESEEILDMFLFPYCKLHMINLDKLETAYNSSNRKLQSDFASILLSYEYWYDEQLSLENGFTILPRAEKTEHNRCFRGKFEGCRSIITKMQTYEAISQQNRTNFNH